MSKGGKREGSGRKPGHSKATDIRRKFQEYFTEDEIIDLIKEVKSQAKKHPDLLRLVIEQLFGKAPQRVELSGKDGEQLIIQVSSEIAQKHGINANTKIDS